MKKIIFFLMLFLPAIALGQEVLKRNLEIQKTSPVLNLNGTGAVLQFYGSDVTLTHGSNLLTLAGGNFALGTNSLTLTGNIAATGARVTHGYFADITLTNPLRGNVRSDSITFDTGQEGDLATVVPLQADTITLFVWSVGIGAASDTANFRDSDHDYDLGGFFWDGSDTLVVTKLIGVVSASGNVAVQISWDANYLDATPTNLNTSAPAITSSTSGTSDTSFDNAEIPPQRWVWLTTPTVTSAPTRLRVSLIGYKRNLSY